MQTDEHSQTHVDGHTQTHADEHIQIDTHRPMQTGTQRRMHANKHTHTDTQTEGRTYLVDTLIVVLFLLLHDVLSLPHAVQRFPHCQDVITLYQSKNMKSQSHRITMYGKAWYQSKCVYYKIQFHAAKHELYSFISQCRRVITTNTAPY